VTPSHCPFGPGTHTSVGRTGFLSGAGLGAGQFRSSTKLQRRTMPGLGGSGRAVVWFAASEFIGNGSSCAGNPASPVLGWAAISSGGPEFTHGQAGLPVPPYPARKVVH